jgi:putative ABC transport system ATP-binding protein
MHPGALFKALSVFALRDINLTIYRGEYISLMGPSGSGKTTFFNMIGALDFPTAGTIRLGGRNMKDLSQSELAYLRCVNIGYIFQNYNLIEVLSAQQNVMLPMRLFGKSEADAAKRAAELCERALVLDEGRVAQAGSAAIAQAMRGDGTIRKVAGVSVADSIAVSLPRDGHAVAV